MKMEKKLNIGIKALHACRKYFLGADNCRCDYDGECTPCTELRNAADALVKEWNLENRD